jgi:muramoyltetrapeptide carboxypeptidase
VTVPRVREGDRVRLVSPASPPSRDGVARGVELLESWGLRVEIGRHAFDQLGYLAGDDHDRLADLNEALRDPGVRAVFATRGGKGAYRIAGQLDAGAARADPKPLVGFSDITYLHLALLRAEVPGGFHGPLLNWSDDYCDARCADNLRRSVGWALPDLRGAILLLEDHHGTGLGQLDRCFAQLFHGGHLARVAGIALGTFGEFETLETSGWTLADVVSGWLDRLAVPVLGGLAVGHGRNPVTVPLGTRTTIDPAAGRMTVAPGVA